MIDSSIKFSGSKSVNLIIFTFQSASAEEIYSEWLFYMREKHYDVQNILNAKML